MDEEYAGLVLADAELPGRGRLSVSLRGGRVTAIGTDAGAGPTIACDGRALLPGLHDHHCHVLASAAARTSIQCGPPEVHNRNQLAERLAAAEPRRGWIRGVGYHESVAGDLDAAALDRLGPGVPTRIQHRSGALWIVNGSGARALGLDDVEISGIERDAAGRPTGRLWRLDDWLGKRVAPDPLPDTAGISRELARYGITGVTDATPDLSPEAVDAIMGGSFRQRLVSLGADLAAETVALGPRKVVVADHDLPTYDELRDRVTEARPRAVALHCVTRGALALSLAVLADAGAYREDRIEHAAVCPPELAAQAAALGLTVVTQPSFVRQRGDEYLDGVDAADLPFLWPFASLLAAGVRVGCSSDGPYGALSPWLSVAAAVERRSMTGRVVAGHERVQAWTALRGYLTRPRDPGGVQRRVEVGAPADLCLLDKPLADALRRPGEVEVLLTCRAGEVLHHAPALVE